MSIKSTLKNSKVHLLYVGNNINEAEQVSTMLRANFSNSIFSKVETITEGNLLFAMGGDPDIVLISPDVPDFNDFNEFTEIKTLKLLSGNVPVILACNDKNHFLGLKSVVNNVDNYILLNKGEVLFKKVIFSSLASSSKIQYARRFIA